MFPLSSIGSKPLLYILGPWNEDTSLNTPEITIVPTEKHMNNSHNPALLDDKEEDIEKLINFDRLLLGRKEE